MKRFAVVLFATNVAALIVSFAVNAAESQDEIAQGKILFEAR